MLRRQFYSAQFMVKITVFREDNQPLLRLQRRQSAIASHYEKTILPVLKKTILLEKTILPFPFLIAQILQKRSKGIFVPITNFIGVSFLIHEKKYYVHTYFYGEKYLLK